MTFYNPEHFRVDDREALVAFVERHAFGSLVSTGPGGLAVSHIPFLPERGPDGRLRLLGHMARANPHWRSLESAAEVMAILWGPHAYVSPTWYETAPSVPTWNYAVVHAHGAARLLPPEDLARLVDRLSQAYEAGRPRPWRMAELAPQYVAKLLGAIVGFAIEVERLEGKFKLSQNRSAADARGVIAALEAAGEAGLAGLMRAARPVPPGEKG